MIKLHKNKRIAIAAILTLMTVTPAAIFAVKRLTHTDNTNAITHVIPSGYTTFTDPNFYDCVASAYLRAHPSEDISLGLTDAQLATITRLVCNGGNKDNSEKIVSTTGLEKMINLEKLELSYNQLTSLDVSNNAAVTDLSAIYNQLTSLDVSNNTALTNLDVFHNQLTSLDVSNNTALTDLSVSTNHLTSLDVSNNTALTNLITAENQLTSLDVSNNTALANLNASYNQLTSLDVSNNTALTDLSVSSNQLTSLDVSNNTALINLEAYVNQLTSLDVSNNTALTKLDARINQIASMDISNNTALTDLNMDSNQLTSLSVSGNTLLTRLDVSRNKLASLDVSNNVALKVFNVWSNLLTSLDVSNNTALTALRASSNQLTSLDISNNTTLADFWSDDILVKTNLSPTYIAPNVTFSLSGLGFLEDNQTINNTDNYTYSPDDMVVAINNLNGTNGYIQVSSPKNGRTFKLQIPIVLLLDTNGGEGSFGTLNCPTGLDTTECDITLPLDAPTRNGYTFLGWADSSNATSATYSAGDTITVLTSKAIYAVWEKIVHDGSEDNEGNNEEGTDDIVIPNTSRTTTPDTGNNTKAGENNTAFVAYVLPAAFITAIVVSYIRRNKTILHRIFD